MSGGANTALGGQAGTSQAAPHVAGLYALIKSVVPQWTVAQMTAWIRDSATQPVQACVGVAAPCAAANQMQFRRIRLPASL
jgi:subtilisin family serine protease